MKNLAVIGLLTIAGFFSSCSKDLVEAEVSVPLTQAEKDDLKFLREEEKLARDVYLFSYDKYGEDIFNSISQSEQKHMDKVLDLLNTYNIEDPMLSERGVFTNQTLQTLYNDLIVLSDKSLLDALLVGATIEDLDIKDIEHNEARTTALDIANVYSKLKCGSTNHMRSFYKKIVNLGGDYTPQFITQEYFDEIINSPNRKCGQE